jgi:hypothetical protein
MFALYSRPYLDKRTQCYMNIVTVSQKPQGPLASFVKRVNFPILSPFKETSSCDKCGLAIASMTTCQNHEYMIVDEVPNLFSYLLANGYKIDTSLTKMMNASDINFQTENSNKLIAFVNYVSP